MDAPARAFIDWLRTMTTPKIACLDVLAPAVQAETRAVAPDFEIRFASRGSEEELIDLVSDADFLLVGPVAVPATLIAHATRVKLIQKYGVGIEKVDLEAAHRAGIVVAIAAGGNAAPVSELALALMLAVNRRIPFGDRVTREGQWPRTEMRETCFQLDGKTVGLYGFGAIARATARRLAGFDVRIIYHSRTPADDATERALRATYVEFDDLLADSDILSIHVPLVPETQHRIGTDALKLMKRSAIIVNTSRGGVVDEIALHDALISGRLRGAGLDVYATEPPGSDNPLFSLDKVVLMPHAGGGVFDNVRKVMGHAVGNMRKLLAGEPISPADLVVAPPAAPT
jgi:D-3-phosphoglycerate dehydrogenase